MSQNNRLRTDKSMELHGRLSFILTNKDGSVNHRASIVTGNATPSATDNLHKRVKSLHLDQSYDKSGKGYDGSLPRINSIAFTKKDLKQHSKIMGMTPASNNHKKQASYLLDKSTAAEHVSVISDSRSNNANHGLSIIANRNLPRSNP